MNVNVERCTAVAAWARAHPEAHNQQFWFYDVLGMAKIVRDRAPVAMMREGTCGTRACLAGTTAVLFAPENTTYSGGILYIPGEDEGRYIAEWARKALGLSPDQAHAVFMCMDDEVAIERLEYLAAHPQATNSELVRALPAPGTDD